MRPSGARRMMPVLFLVVVMLTAGCGGPRRLDELVVYDTETFTLKVVRYYESLFLHYDGEIFVVMCRDPSTAAMPAMATQDAGWRMLGRGPALGTTSAADLLPAIRERYLVRPAGGLVVRGVVLRASRSGCGPFIIWDPTRQADLEIDPVPKPDFCAPVGTGDCRYHDFFDERRPAYEDVEIDDDRIRFIVTSPAFVPSRTLEVTSTDGGRSWQWAPIGEPIRERGPDLRAGPSDR